MSDADLEANLKPSTEPTWADRPDRPFQLAADILHLRTWGHPLNAKESARLDEQLRLLALNVKNCTRDRSYL